MRGAEFLEYLTKPPPTSWFEHERMPVHRQDDYIHLLRKNYESCGIDFDENKFKVPYDPPKIQKFEEPEIITHPFGQVYLSLTYTKTKVKVKMNYALYAIHEKFYACGKVPPVKVVVQALKSIGYSDELLKKVIRGYDENQLWAKKIWKYLELKLFKDDKKKKIKKEKIKVVDNDVEEDADADDETVSDGEEENPFDMEIDDDDEYVQDDDEVIFSDVDDE